MKTQAFVSAGKKADWLLLLPGTLFLVFALAACTKIVSTLIPGGTVQEGETLFSLSCAGCHDADAEGDGPDHTRFIPPPANLTLIRNTETMTYSIVTRGVPGTAMPGKPIPEGIFKMLLAYIATRPYDTSREWEYPWRLDEEDRQVQAGSKIYATACSGCHGKSGAGDGNWGNDADIRPPPANFHARNSDIGRIYHIISSGRPGTMMAPQADTFPERSRWALARYVAGLFDPASDAEIRVPERDAPSGRNPFSGDDDGAVQQGEKTYNLYCFSCHGAQAKGSFLAPRLTDRSWKYGGGRDDAAFLVITKGIPGKLMPAHDPLSEDRRWQVVAWLRHRGGLPDPLAGED